MSEEKQTPIGTMIVVAIAAGLIGYVIGKPTPPQVQAEVPDASEKPAEPQEPAFMKEGLVAHYPFNGNAKDESGNGNDGEVKGATLVNDRHGKSNAAYSFDGKNQIETSIINQTDHSFTFTVWAKSEVEISQTGKSVIIDKLDDYRLAFEDGIGEPWLNTQGLEFGYRDIQNRGGVGVSSLSITNWNQFVGIYNDNSKKFLFFVNGKKIISQKDWGPIKKRNTNKNPIIIGKKNSQPHEIGFRGSIDDLRIYNRALTEEQVKALYDWEKPKAENPAEPQEPAFLKEGLVASYPFNGNAKDESGNGNDGEVKGATLVNDRHGKSKNAFRFDENPNAVITSAPLKDSDSFYSSLWLKIEEFENNQYVLFEGDSRADFDLGLTVMPDGYLRLRTKDNHKLISEEKIPLKKWTHIYMAADSGKEKALFVNGLKFAVTENWSGKANIGNHDVLCIGNGVNAGNVLPNVTVKGVIDDVRIYNRALTEEQVKALYEWEKPKAE
jgi:hypothetical protein